MRGRSATSTIWKTVVFAGAMLGTAACGGKSNNAQTAPDNTAEAAPDEATPTEPPGEDVCAGEDPCAGEDEDPCAGRPRGSEDEEGGVGRGFVLS